MPSERQLTTANHGHILTNANVWSPDGQWIVYDGRSDHLGAIFDGRRIERVHVETGKVETLYESLHGAYCGVATYSPVDDRIVFILGPEHPSPDWSYSACHRQGAILDPALPGQIIPLDARELTPPFIPGALRGGTHLHLFNGDATRVSFTYEDHLLTQNPGKNINQRNVGVTQLGRTVVTSRRHPRNCDGSGFSVLVTRTTRNPIAGSDEISRAAEEAWVGSAGYLKPDGQRQKYAIAFQGEVISDSGQAMLETFIVDLPEDLTQTDEGFLAGTETELPRPPRGTVQRRLTFSQDRRFPGLAGPRHWLRSSPDGSLIAMLMRDDAGIVQIFGVSPNGGAAIQLTRNSSDVASAFSWSPDGTKLAYIADSCVVVTDIHTGKTSKRTARTDDQTAALPLACVFSPNGKMLAYLRSVSGRNQIFVCNAVD